MRILGTNHCGAMRCTAFKRSELFQDFLCHLDYAERVVETFDNQIQSKLYGVNRSVYIEGIASEKFSAVLHTSLN